jgi:PAS domain S-box-containing protein
MKDRNKTKKQLINELEELRQRIAELELLIGERKEKEDGIRALKQQLEFIVGVTKTGLDIIDSEFNIRYIDPAWAKVYGDPAGKKCYEYFMGRKGVCLRCGIIEALKTKKPIVTEEVLVKENNRHIQVTTIPFKNEAEEWLLAEVNVDITERKKMEEAVRESEEKYHQVVEYANQGILIVQDGMVKFPNPKISEISGYSKEELYSKPVLEFVHPDDRKMVAERHLKSIEGTEVPHIYEFRIVDKDGNIRWVEINATLIIWEGRPATLNFLSDISKRKEAEEKVCNYQEQLRSLASELSLIEERERRQIATDLHDHIGQNLAIAKIKLGDLREKTFSTNLADHVDEIRKYVEESIQITRSLTFELSPPILHELGFEAAMEWLTEQIQGQHKIQIEVEAEMQSRSMSEEVQVFLFKATKELLINIVKHAQAQNAKVSIRSDNDNIRVLVEDDGVGFYSYKDKQISKGNGFGLFSISERLKYLGGSFEIESKPGQGTRVTLVAPLKWKENYEERGT